MSQPVQLTLKFELSCKTVGLKTIKFKKFKIFKTKILPKKIENLPKITKKNRKRKQITHRSLSTILSYQKNKSFFPNLLSIYAAEYLHYNFELKRVWNKGHMISRRIENESKTQLILYSELNFQTFTNERGRRRFVSKSKWRLHKLYLFQLP